MAHGNGGGLQLDRYLWNHYSYAAEKGIGPHYNIIGIRYGYTNIGKAVMSGIKFAKILEHFSDTRGLNISDVHGIGFRFPPLENILFTDNLI